MNIVLNFGIQTLTRALSAQRKAYKRREGMQQQNSRNQMHGRMNVHECAKNRNFYFSTSCKFTFICPHLNSAVYMCQILSCTPSLLLYTLGSTMQEHIRRQSVLLCMHNYSIVNSLYRLTTFHCVKCDRCSVHVQLSTIKSLS